MKFTTTLLTQNCVVGSFSLILHKILKHAVRYEKFPQTNKQTNKRFLINLSIGLLATTSLAGCAKKSDEVADKKAELVAVQQAIKELEPQVRAAFEPIMTGNWSIAWGNVFFDEADKLYKGGKISNKYPANIKDSTITANPTAVRLKSVLPDNPNVPAWDNMKHLSGNLIEKYEREEELQNSL